MTRGVRMYYIENRRIIIARENEIFDKPEYEHIQEIINNHPGPDVHQLVYGEHILIFDVLKTYEGKNKIIDDCVYVDLLCLCDMKIMIDYDLIYLNTSDISYLEQLRQIRLQYPEFNIPEMITVPIDVDELYGIKTIIPLRFDHFLGLTSEFEDEVEDEE